VTDRKGIIAIVAFALVALGVGVWSARHEAPAKKPDTCHMDLAKAQSALGNREQALALLHPEHVQLEECRDKLDKMRALLPPEEQAPGGS